MSRKPWFIYIYLNLQNFRFKYVYMYIYIIYICVYIYIYIYIFTIIYNIYICNHGNNVNNVPSLLSPQWLCGNSCTCVVDHSWPLKISTHKLVLNIAFHGLIPRNSSHPEVVCKKGALENFAKFTGKHLCRVFLRKLKALYLKRDSNAAIFLWILKKFSKQLFL